jgi:hypothetical protein
MKNLIKNFLIICALGYAHLGHVQYCEFDSVGFSQTEVKYIAELPDKSLVLAGKKGVGGQDINFVKTPQAIFIKKIDSCNRLIWNYTNDSVYDFGDYLWVTKLENHHDTILIRWSNFKFDNHTFYEAKLTDPSGIFYRMAIDSLNSLNVIAANCIKMQDNKFMFVGSLSANNLTRVLIMDSLKNLFSLKDYAWDNFKPIINDFKRFNPNKIALVLKNANYDSVFKILPIN